MQQLTMFQLTERVARTRCDSWAFLYEKNVRRYADKISFSY